MYELIKKEIELIKVGRVSGAERLTDAYFSDDSTYEPGFKIFKANNENDIKLEKLDGYTKCIRGMECKISQQISANKAIFTDDLRSYLSELSELANISNANKKDPYFLEKFIENITSKKILIKETIDMSTNHEDLGRLICGIKLCGSSKKQAKALAISVFKENNLKPANGNCAPKAYNHFINNKKYLKIENFIVVEYFKLYVFFNSNINPPSEEESSTNAYKESLKYYFELKKRVELLGKFYSERGEN